MGSTSMTGNKRAVDSPSLGVEGTGSPSRQPEQLAVQGAPSGWVPYLATLLLSSLVSLSLEVDATCP